jgi:hypothetical protein
MAQKSGEMNQDEQREKHDPPGRRQKQVFEPDQQREQGIEDMFDCFAVISSEAAIALVNGAFELAQACLVHLGELEEPVGHGEPSSSPRVVKPRPLKPWSVGRGAI